MAFIASGASNLGASQKISANNVTDKRRAWPEPRPSCPSCGKLRRNLLGALEPGLGLHSKCGETCGVVGGDVGEDLAVEAVASLLEAVDKGGIAHNVDA